MKNLKRILIGIALILSPVILMAQTGMEDVVYLKNGSIYRGIIIEQVPNVSLKIETAGGNVFAVQMSEVEKIAKERLAVHSAEQHTPQCGHGMPTWGQRDTTFVARRRGFFFQSQILVENTQGGVRLIGGYKLGRFGQLGIGVGFDRVFSSPANEKLNGLNEKSLAGLYLPLYLYHSRDMFSNRRFTPTMAAEVGYAMAVEGMNGEFRQDDFGYRPKGGVMAGIGLGFKMYSKRHKGHASIIFNLSYKQVNYERDVNVFNSSGQVTGTFPVEGKADLLFPGIRFGFGF
ncbi:MAG: hypothetical protein K9J06_05415 [Flavobacteriales bacterium]|nr:hypothetical protein [Flavobacteriales bacterium]